MIQVAAWKGWNLAFLCSAFLWSLATAADTMPAAAHCHKDFDRFLRAFGSDEGVQRRWTRFPLPYKSIDTSAQPEPRSRQKTLSRRTARFPLMPLDAARAEKRLRLRVTKQSANWREVQLQQDDTDWLTHYQFSRGRCWMLVGIDSHSL